MPSALHRRAHRIRATARVRLGSALGMQPASVRVAEEGAPVLGDTASPTSSTRTLGDVLPAAVRGGRLRLETRAVALFACVAVAAVLVAGWHEWQARATPAVQTPTLRSTGTAVDASPVPAGAAPSPSPTPTVLVVDVAGRVRRPGLVQLPPGSRVADALAAAGGALPGVDMSTLNLARLVADGEQVLVGVPGGAPASGTTTGGTAAGAPVDLNSATVAQLDELPGVGPVLAQRIVDWRTAHGRFTSVDQLSQVGGIGPKKLGDITPHVRV